MSLTFNNFKREIPATVLTRGREYFQTGQVMDLEEDGDDSWVAVVQGTKSYGVRVKRLADKSLEAHCPCPYDYGPHCKHIAATLYAIEEAFPEQFEGKRRKSTTQRATKFDRLRAALDAAPHRQLVDLLLDAARGDREFQSYLLMQLGGADNPADVRALVKDALRPPRGSYGFLDYWASTQAGIKVGAIVGRADEALASAPAKALTIYQIVLEETAGALQHADDSSGVLSGNAERALKGLWDCAERLPPEARAELFNYCLKTAVRDNLQGWDYSWGLLGLAAELVETKAARAALYDRLETKLQSSNPDGYPSEFNQTRIAEIKLAVITRLDGEDEALKFIIAHKHLKQFRAILIEYHIERDDLDAALELIREGQDELTQAGGFYRGIALYYRKYLLEIAQMRGDTGMVIDQARALWLGRAGHEYHEYYNLLKEAIPAAEWPAYRDALLSDKACHIELAAWACAQEGLWARVRDITLTNRYLLPAYQLELEKRFPDELAVAYLEYARKLLEKVSNRTTYSEAAGFLIRMRLLGHGEEGKAAARALMEQHPQRRAMIDELKQVF